MRSSATSSSFPTSAFRVTRNVEWSMISVLGNSKSRFDLMTSSSSTNRVSSPIRTRRGRFLGIFTRENVGSESSSRRVNTAIERLKLEMNGNGWAGSNVSGVSVGNTDCSKYSRRSSRSADESES